MRKTRLSLLFVLLLAGCDSQEPADETVRVFNLNRADAVMYERWAQYLFEVPEFTEAVIGSGGISSEYDDGSGWVDLPMQNGVMVMTAHYRINQLAVSLAPSQPTDITREELPGGRIRLTIR